MKKKLATVKSHIHNHRGAYASIATSIVLGYVISKRAEEWNEFLDEHGLLEEFYSLED